MRRERRDDRSSPLAPSRASDVDPSPPAGGGEQVSDRAVRARAHDSLLARSAELRAISAHLRKQGTALLVHNADLRAWANELTTRSAALLRRSRRPRDE